MERIKGKDGTKIVLQRNGIKIVLLRSGIKIVLLRSGTKIVLQRSGTKIVLQRSWIKIVLQRSGTKTVLQRSGIRIVLLRNGIKTVLQRSGTKIVPQKSGTKKVIIKQLLIRMQKRLIRKMATKFTRRTLKANGKQVLLTRKKQNGTLQAKPLTLRSQKQMTPQKLAANGTLQLSLTQKTTRTIRNNFSF